MTTSLHPYAPEIADIDALITQAKTEVSYCTSVGSLDSALFFNQRLLRLQTIKDVLLSQDKRESK